MFIIPLPVVIKPERYPDPWKSLVPMPTAVIEPPVPITAVTAAPAKGANPNPPVYPIDIICPDLGNWFWFTSDKLTIWVPSADEIPLNTKLVIPVDSINS